MKNKLIICLVIILIFPITSFSIDNDYQEKVTNYIKEIDSIEQIEKLEQFIQKKEINNEKIEYIKEKLDERKKYLQEKHKKINKILIWYSTQWKEIFAYYRWDITKEFFGIFANIHWWYEYWTFLTSLKILEELKKQDKTQWFIIPTINPDWLQIALDNKFKNKFYLSWRDNANWVDLNRNFCTNDYKSLNFEKYLKSFSTWDYCGSEIETQNIKKLLEQYKFSKIISLHSVWAIFFIPDNTSHLDEMQSFLKDLKEILPNYSYQSPEELSKKYSDKNSIYYYEINEWNKWEKREYSWIMENYIYEKYKTPVILIELESHWKIENRLLDVLKLME